MSAEAPDDLVATRLGISPADLRRWEDLGLIERGAHGGFAPEALERIRLLRYVAERGIDVADIADLARREGDVLGRYVQFITTPRPLGRSLEEAAVEVGLDVEFMRRLWVSSGQGDRDEILDDDLESFRGLALAVHAGMPADAMLQVARVLGDSLGRVADAEVRLFHFYVHQDLRSSGLDGKELHATSIDTAHSLRGLGEAAVDYYHRASFERSMREDMLLHLAEDISDGDAGRGALLVAVLFVDLAGFTPLTEAMGDHAAAKVLDRFSDLVREGASSCSGRVVKQIGDEFMLVFPDGQAALRFGLELMDEVAHEDEFPGLRIGAHMGPALYREADYLGATVNTAARVVGAAERGQFLATAAMHERLGGASDVHWRPIGTRRLKGLSNETALYEASAARRSASPRIDPVCGMQLSPERQAIRLEWEGRTLDFCSERCRERFLEGPSAFLTDGSEDSSA